VILTFFSRILLPLLVFATAVGIYLNYIDFPLKNSVKQCNIDLTQECIVFDQGQQISVQFLQEIEVEEEISFTITTTTDTKIKNMWVQGVNMYMGKNAVIVESVYAKEMKKVYKAHLFLGSCSEPEMRWQLIVRTTDNNEFEQSWFFNFSTDRNKKTE
jgi:hypothetical protein